MLSNHLKVVLILISVLVIVVGVYGWHWFHKNYEYRTRVGRSSMSIEAKRNPLLASEMFLTRLGLDVKSYSGRQYLLQPPEDPGLLFVYDLGLYLSESHVAQLLSWVERGGHLVVSPSNSNDTGYRSDPLLKKFGVSQHHLIEHSLDEADVEFEGEKLLLPGMTEGLSIDFDQQRWFEIEKDFKGVSPVVVHSQYLTFPWGTGYVTLISDVRVFNNQQISQSDHARLLAYLAPEQDKVWLLYGIQMPSLLMLIWQRFPYLVLTLVPIGLLIIWRMTRNTGPKLTLETAGRRDLLEHLQASAEFAWRNNLKSNLFEGVRDQVEKRWLKAHPMLLTLDKQARCDWLAQRTKMTSSVIYQTLYSEKGDSTHLIKNTVNLQRLIASLQSYRKVKSP
jgi:hypothetical protein